MDATISIRTNSVVKNKVIKILKARGLSLSTALNMYLSDIANKKTSPVSDVRYVKDEIMEKWEKEKNRALKSGKRYKNTDEYIKYLIK